MSKLQVVLCCGLVVMQSSFGADLEKDALKKRLDELEKRIEKLDNEGFMKAADRIRPQLWPLRLQYRKLEEKEVQKKNVKTDECCCIIM